MISKTYVISSSISMSKQYIHRNPNLGFAAARFRDFVTELYNHPLFLFENEEIEAYSIHQIDLRMCRIRKHLSKDNYFYDSMVYRGNRLLIHKTLEVLDISLEENDRVAFKLPHIRKEDSLRELFNLYKDEVIHGYSTILNSVIDRVTEGRYDSIFTGIELLLLSEFEITGREADLLILLKEKIKIENLSISDITIDYSRVECSSSITASGTINKAFKWMGDKGLTSENTVFVALDYDTYATQIYQLHDYVPVYLDKGLLCKHFACFEQFLTNLKEKQNSNTDNVEFLKKTEASLRMKSKGEKKSELDKIFYEKVLSGIADLMSVISQYSELDIIVDAYELLVEQVSELRFSASELSLKPGGFSLYDLDDVYALKNKNVIVLGLDHANYPRKKKIDPLLKENERTSINNSIKGTINKKPFYIENKLDRLLTNCDGKISLSYESHDSDTGKFTVPSGFFNNVLKFLKKEIRIKNIYELCKVNETYVEDLIVQGDYLPVSTNKLLESSFNQQQRTIYSNSIEDIDFGEFEGFRKKLSASSLELFYKCPYAFHLKYNEKLDPPELGEMDKTVWLDAATRGSLLHKLYELMLTPFLNSNMSYPDYLRSIDEQTIESFLDAGLDLKQNDYNSFRDYNSTISDSVKDRELKEIQDNMKKFLDNECDNECDNDDSFYPVSLEHEFAFSIDIKGESIDFKGYIDRIDTNGSGGYRVIDYKTGKNYFKSTREYLFCVDGKGKNGDKHYFQHAIYSHALRVSKNFTPVSSLEAGYYFSSDKGNWKKVIHKGVPPEEKLVQILGTYIGEVKKEQYFKNATQCAFCDYRPFCKNKQNNRLSVTFDQLENLANTVREIYA